jgi:hypothetical protein
VGEARVFAARPRREAHARREGEAAREGAPRRRVASLSGRAAVLDAAAKARLVDASSPWRWLPRPPAAAEAIARLERAADVPLPADYLELLRTCDGGEGALGLAPLWLVLWDADRAAEHGRAEAWPGLFAFGTNGGEETLAFDLRERGRAPVVMFDPDGGVDTVRTIAPDVAALVAAIGQDLDD